MKNFTAAMVMAAAVVTVSVMQDRHERRMDEVHRMYQLRIKEARDEGVQIGKAIAPARIEPSNTQIVYPMAGGRVEDHSPRRPRRFGKS